MGLVAFLKRSDRLILWIAWLLEFVLGYEEGQESGLRWVGGIEIERGMWAVREGKVGPWIR